MENEKGIVKLTRKQLYDEIWALSVAGVARIVEMKILLQNGLNGL